MWGVEMNRSVKCCLGYIGVYGVWGRENECEGVWGGA